jgi:hypothetical protein
MNRRKPTMKIFSDLSLEAKGDIHLEFLPGSGWDRIKMTDKAEGAYEVVNIYTSHSIRDRLARAVAAFEAVMTEQTGHIIAGEDECETGVALTQAINETLAEDGINDNGEV